MGHGVALGIARILCTAPQNSDKGQKQQVETGETRQIMMRLSKQNTQLLSFVKCESSKVLTSADFINLREHVQVSDFDVWKGVIIGGYRTLSPTSKAKSCRKGKRLPIQTNSTRTLRYRRYMVVIEFHPQQKRRAAPRHL
jgi:hypothetical protein